MSALAASSARPICPRCGRAVRSGVELSAACADVECSSTPRVVLERVVRHLAAELAGEHLDCRMVSQAGGLR